MNNNPNRYPFLPSTRHSIPPTPYNYQHIYQGNPNNFMPTQTGVNHSFVQRNVRPQIPCNFPPCTVTSFPPTQPTLLPPSAPPACPANLLALYPQSTQQQRQSNAQEDLNEMSASTVEPQLTEYAEHNNDFIKKFVNLGKAIDSLNNKNISLLKKLEEEKMISQKLRVEQKIYKDQLEDSQKEVESLKIANDVALNEAEDKIREAVSQQNVYKETFDCLNDQLISANNKISQKDKQIDELQKKIGESESQLIKQKNNLEASEEVFRKSIKDKDGRIKDLEIKIKELGEISVQKTTANELLRKEIGKLKETVSLQEAKIMELQMEQQKLNFKVADLNGKLVAKSEEVCTVSNKLKTLSETSNAKFDEMELELGAAFRDFKQTVFGNN